MRLWQRLVWRKPFRHMSRRGREDSELDEELRFHLQQEAQLRIDRGQSPEDARQWARRDFGNVTRTREVTREMWTFSALDRAAQDLRYAARMFLKNPAFTALALASLTLGIGATTAIFSVVNSVLLRPLPFRDPDQLVMVWERPPETGHNNVVQTQNFLDWRARNRSFENMAAVFQISTNLEGQGEAVQLPTLRVTAGFFETLGVAPLIGRAILAADNIPDAPCVTVLSYGLWQRRFGGQPGVIGTKLSLAAGPGCEVVGVMPAGFALPTNPRVDLYTPMQIEPSTAPRDGRNYSVVARMRKGVSLGQADADMRAIAAQTSVERPEMNARWSAAVVPLLQQTVGDMRATLLVLLGAVLFLLLIACTNVSNLLLMRASKRRREMTVRIALGAGRWQLIHQLMMESLLLSVAGGIAGFLLAYWGVPAIIGMLPAGFPLPRRGEIAVDPSVLAFTMFLSLGCGMFFGTFPALQAGRERIGEGLRQGDRHGSAGNRRVRNLLVVAEVGLAMLLVIGAGLMLRSFILLNAVDPGFRPERLVTFRMVLFSHASTMEQVIARRATLVAQMIDRIRVLPGVAAASSIHLLPMTGGGNSGTWYSRADRPAPPPASNSGGDVSIVSDDYFRTMGIPIAAGREFDAHDSAGSPRVGVLNRTAAQQIFPGENPVGKRLRVAWGPGPNEVEIVGITADIHHRGLDGTPEPCLFMPQAQQPSAFVSLLVRTAANPVSLIPAVKEQIHAVYPSQGIQDIQTMEEVVAGSIARPKLDATILGVFGAMALALACLGIYAVISYSVEQRMREMGIRLALGAAPAGILGMVLGEGMTLAAAGIAAGIGASLGLTRYLSSLLYAVKPADPAVFGAVTMVLALAAAAGCYFPARRATRVDPAMVLREE
jgi:putative ABC transport system permease protein